MAAYVLFYPLDIVRVKQQLSDVSRPFPDVVSKLFKEEGPTSLYKGVEASAFSVAVSSAIYFFCFKSLEQILAKQKKSNVRRLGIAYVHFLFAPLSKTYHARTTTSTDSLRDVSMQR